MKENKGRTQCSGPWDPHFYPQAADCSPPCLSQEMGGFVFSSSRNTLPLFRKRLLTSVLIKKTPGLQHLVPSLAYLYANHILESEEKRESPSPEKGQCPHQRGSPAAIQADTGPVDGCQSSITDFKMLRVYVQPEGDIFHFNMN